MNKDLRCSLRVRIFESIKYLGIPNVNMKYRSMGMTNSYRGN